MSLKDEVERFEQESKAAQAKIIELEAKLAEVQKQPKTEIGNFAVSPKDALYFEDEIMAVGKIQLSEQGKSPVIITKFSLPHFKKAMKLMETVGDKPFVDVMVGQHLPIAFGKRSEDGKSFVGIVVAPRIESE